MSKLVKIKKIPTRTRIMILSRYSADIQCSSPANILEDGSIMQELTGKSIYAWTPIRNSLLIIISEHSKIKTTYQWDWEWGIPYPKIFRISVKNSFTSTCSHKTLCWSFEQHFKTTKTEKKNAGSIQNACA